ncbi:MAG: DNA polymerase domain-containing protein, partial [Candidatus Baldrarchaeia archaeon]
DWCELAKRVQREVIEIILKERNPKKALDYVKNVIEEIRRGLFPLEDYVIYKGLTKKLEKYESKQAHVKAALRAMEMGVYYPVGTKVGFVVVKGGGSVSDRAYPIELIEDFDGENLKIRTPSGIILRKIDKEYYIDHQIIPAVLRILERFGYTEASLKVRTQKTLFDFT